MWTQIGLRHGETSFSNLLRNYDKFIRNKEDIFFSLSMNYIFTSTSSHEKFKVAKNENPIKLV